LPSIIHTKRGRIALGIAVLAVLLGAVLVASFQGRIGTASAEPLVIYEVVVDGAVVAYVEDPDEIRRAVAALEERETLARRMPVRVTSRVEGRPLQVTADQRPRLSDGTVLEDELAQAVRLAATAFAIVVDGEPVVALRSEADARAAVERVQELYREQLEAGEFRAPDGTRIDESVQIQTVEILENIRYEAVDADTADIKDVDQAVAVLMRGTDRVVAHTVQSGESLWVIARNHGMSVEDLEKANPQVTDPKRLQPGDQLNLIVPDPYVSLRSVEVRTYQRPIPFATRVEYDPGMYPWEEYVKEPGRQGRRAVVERVERLNGEIVSVEVLSDELISEPTVQVVVKGSKEVEGIGSGIFRWPLNIPGQVTTRFGYSRWRGRNHDGIDIAAPKGTPVYAVDNGYVSFTGWKNGLGNTVIVDHGGGRQTVYGHLSSINVKKGDQVTKTTVLGGVGSTGFSTGNHLHFEVHVNGRAVDPMPYFQ